MSEDTQKKTDTGFQLVIGLIIGLFAMTMLIIGLGLAIPGFISYQYKGKHSEVSMNLSAIKILQEAYEADYDIYLEAAAYPPHPAQEPQPWIVDASGGFVALGWAPEGAVRGSYSVTTTTTDFRAVGVMDVDGDGHYATYVATSSTAPHRLTSADVY